MEKIKTKAVLFGTFNSPTTGSILYVDPNHNDEAFHSPELTYAEAKYAFERGLIEDPDGVDTAIQGERLISDLGVERVESIAGDISDESKGAAMTGLDSRQTTAWNDADRVLGGADGFVAPNLNTPPVGNAVENRRTAAA